MSPRRPVIRRESDSPETDSVDFGAFVRRTRDPGIPYEVVSIKPSTSRDLVADKFRDGPVVRAGDAVDPGWKPADRHDALAVIDRMRGAARRAVVGEDHG